MKHLARWLPAVIAMLTVLVVPKLLLPGEIPALAKPDLLQLPALQNCVKSDVQPITRSRINGADQRMEVTYRCGEVNLQIDVARFLSQHPGKEAVTESNLVVETEHVGAALPYLRDVTDQLSIREYRLDQLDRSATLWSWYAIGDAPYALANQAKIRELLNAMALRSEDASVITLVAWGNEARTNQTLAQAASELWDWYLLREQAPS